MGSSAYQDESQWIAQGAAYFSFKGRELKFFYVDMWAKCQFGGGRGGDNSRSNQEYILRMSWRHNDPPKKQKFDFSRIREKKKVGVFQEATYDWY